MGPPERLVQFVSDNNAGIAPEAMEALARANAGHAPGYGADRWTREAEDAVRRTFDADAPVWFVPTGTAATALAIAAICRSTDAVICHELAHVNVDECGACEAMSGGAKLLTVRGTGAKVTPGALALRAVAHDVHASRPRALSLTQATELGTVYSPDELAALAGAAHARGLAVHLDGARLFNAAVASGRDVRALAAPADTVSVCLSKGLGAPVGSLLAGDRARITAAHRFRKMLGGGMRQAGIIAAAGIVALDEMVDRLAEDHHRAAVLGDGLRSMAKVHLTKNSPQTNMVFFKLDESVGLSVSQFLDAMKQEGVLLMDSGPAEYRMVTHNDITDKAIEVALDAFKKVLG